MTRMSKGGIVLTGIGAYLIMSKGINMIRKVAKDITDAIKWREYCKCPDKSIVPPGYSRTTTYADGTIVYDDPRGRTQQEIETSKSNSKAVEESGKVLGEAVADVISSSFKKGLNEKREALENQIEASKKKIEELEKDISESEEIKMPPYEDYYMGNDNITRTHVTVDGDTDGDAPTIHVVKDEKDETVD